jgi:hypothetical protein
VSAPLAALAWRVQRPSVRSDAFLPACGTLKRGLIFRGERCRGIQLFNLSSGNYPAVRCSNLGTAELPVVRCGLFIYGSSRWRAGFDGVDWWSQRAGRYPVGDDRVTEEKRCHLKMLSSLPFLSHVSLKIFFIKYQFLRVISINPVFKILNIYKYLAYVLNTVSDRKDRKDAARKISYNNCCSCSLN